MKNIFYVILIYFVVFLSSLGLAQEKKEPPTNKKEEKKLPELRERKYTIFGKEELEFKDAEKIINKIDFYKSKLVEESSLKLGITDRILGELSKTSQLFVTQKDYRNIVHLSFGRYKDLSLGVITGWIRNNDEIRLFSEINRNSGFIENSGFFTADINLDYTRLLNNYSSVDLNIDFNKHDYKFYSEVLDGLKRKLANISLISGLNIYKWKRTKMYLKGSLSFLSGKDDKELKETELKGIAEIKSYLSDISINGGVQYILNSNKIDGFENKSINGRLNYNFVQSYIEIRKRINENLAFWGGVKHYITEKYDTKEKIYPSVGLNLNFDKDTDIIINYRPEIIFKNSNQLLNENRFISFSSMPYFEYVDFNFITSVRKKFNKNIQIQGSYSLKKIENFGVYLLNSNYKKWEKNNDVKLKLNTLSADLKYVYNDKLNFSLLGEIYKFSSIEKLNKGNDIPYFPDYRFNLNLNYSLSKIKTFIKANGNLIGRRFFYEYENKKKLNPYLLLNICIGNDMINNFEIYFVMNNILNTRYEIWNGYQEPDFIMAGGFKYFWK